MSLLKVSSSTGVKETERNEDSGIQSSTLLRVYPDRYKAELRLIKSPLIWETLLVVLREPELGESMIRSLSKRGRDATPLLISYRNIGLNIFVIFSS